MKRFWKGGDPFIWLTGGALAFALIMVAGLVILILWNGLGFFWPTDVTRLASVHAMIDATVDRYGGLDIVVINAGVNGERKSVEAADPERWRPRSGKRRSPPSRKGT